ncbi:ArdC-like ssDNA-binding domain-containing protein [Plastoroseomonas hellenica]
MRSVECGYSRQSWLSFRQASPSAAAPANKGERGITVVYADRFIPDQETGARKEDRQGSPRDPFPQTFLTVFTVEHLAVVAFAAGDSRRASSATLRSGSWEQIHATLSDAEEPPPVRHPSMMVIYRERGGVAPGAATRGWAEPKPWRCCAP